MKNKHGVAGSDKPGRSASYHYATDARGPGNPNSRSWQPEDPAGV